MIQQILLHQRLLDIKLDHIGVPGEEQLRDTRIVFHHGQCVGGDEQGALMARKLGYWIVAHPPHKDDYLSSFVSDETREPKDYLPRNDDIVVESQQLFGLPRSYTNILRGSGTWSTIRHADRTLTPYTIIYPDGSEGRLGEARS